MPRDFFRKAQKRSYQSGSYRNPHLDRTKPIPWRTVGLFASGGIVVLGFAVFFFAHPLFRIDRVEVFGLESIPRSDLERAVTDYLAEPALLVFNKGNQFLCDPSDLAQRLQEAFALFSVTGGLREGTLFITLEERTSNLFWKTQERLFVVDLEGIVVREVTGPDDSFLTQPNLKELPIFVDANDVEVQIGVAVLSAEEIDHAFIFLELLETTGIGYTYIELDRLAGKWARLETQPGYSILFDLLGDMDQQFQNLKTVLDEQIDDPAVLEYIDLRFGDRVYYK